MGEKFRKKLPRTKELNQGVGSQRELFDAQTHKTQRQKVRVRERKEWKLEIS